MSGLIFVALALVWAVALLPKALRHHDEVAQTRSVDGVSDSARVLARREVVSPREARLVVTPAKQAPAPAPAPAPEVVAAPTRPVSWDRMGVRIAAQRKATATAARRRRLVLGVLLALCLGTGVLAGLGQLALWAPAVPVALTIGFLVLARITVRRERARWDAELRRLRSTVVAAPPVMAEVEGPDVAVGSQAPDDAKAADDHADHADVAEVNEQGLTVVSGLDDTSSFPLGLLDDVVPTTDAGSLWDPLPVTLPTYVSKPRANRSVRTIDLQAPGVASSGHDAASSALVAEAATATPPDDLPQQAVGS